MEPNRSSSKRIWLAGCGIAGALAVGLCAIVSQTALPSLYRGELPKGPLPILQTPTAVTPVLEQLPIDVTLGPAPSVQAQATRAPVPAPTIDANAPKGDREQQKRAFEQLWILVNTDYVYPDFNGLDWEAEKIRMFALIDTGISDAQFHAEQKSLIERLSDRHSSYLSPADVVEEEAMMNRSSGFTGIGIVVEVSRQKDYLYVLHTYPGSPAETADIKPHDRILSINGVRSVSERGQSQVLLLRGEPGSTVVVAVQSPGQNPRDISVTRGLVTRALAVEARMLPSAKKIGYIRIPTFDVNDTWKDVRTELQTLMAANNESLDGLVLDLRINPGGGYVEMAQCLSLFADGAIGQFVKRGQAPEPLEVSNTAFGNSDRVPLVVLVSRSTGSFGEIFAAALQRSGRARIVGQPTAGNIEVLRRTDLDDGARVYLAEQTYQPENGKNWEGVGLTPDIAVDADWDTYTPENDPVLAAGLTALTTAK